MRYLLLLLASSITCSVRAQHLSIGASAGTECFFHRESFYQSARPNVALGGSVFIRWERLDRWSYEAAFSHSAYHEIAERYIHIISGCFGGPVLPYNALLHTELNVRVYTASLKADYRLSGDTASRFRHYIGFQITPTLYRSTLRERLYDSATLREATDFAAINAAPRNFRIWAGLQYTVSYRINPQLTVRTVAAYTADPYYLIDEWKEPAYAFNVPYGKISAQIGLSYGIR